MLPKSIKMKIPFSINFNFFIILSIFFIFGLIPIAFGYNTDTGSQEQHLFRHRHHDHQHHQHQKQSHEPHYYSHRLENAVDEFKRSQDQNHKNITMVNLRHHRTYIVDDIDDSSSSSNGISGKSTTEEPILQFAPLSADSVTSNGKNHHLRHHNRHHQMWEQRVFPSLRHHPTTTTLISNTAAPTTTTKQTATITTTTDRSLSFPKNKFHYFNNFGGRRFGDSNGIGTTKTDFNNHKLNLTKTNRYFERDGGLYSWNGFTTTTTRPPLTRRWQSFDDKHFVEKSFTTFSDDNRFQSNNDDDDDNIDSSDSDEGNGNDDNVKDDIKDLIKKKKQQQMQQQKKKKSNLLSKKLNFRNMKNLDEYYVDDDDVNGEESESGEDEDYNSEENNDDDDDLSISNESRNYVERRTLPKRKTFNMNSDDIYSRSYKPGTLTQQKYEMLGTHEAVKQSRKLHITNQRHHKALATAHITKVTKEAACGIPKPRVERIQRETSKLYVPHCTILHRCGDDTGCCLSDSKTCVAKKTQDVTLYFFVKSMNSNQGTIERLTFKNHTECHCVQKSKHNTNNINFLMEPAMLRKATVLDCNCPKLFEKVLQDDGYCRCDCSSGNSNCDWLKRGMEHFSMVDRKCIIEGRCKPPTCEFGSYVKKHGRCPKKDDKMSSYSRSFH